MSPLAGASVTPGVLLPLGVVAVVPPNSNMLDVADTLLPSPEAPCAAPVPVPDVAGADKVLTVGSPPSLVLILRTRAPRVSGVTEAAVLIELAVAIELELPPVPLTILPRREAVKPPGLERVGDAGEVSRTKDVAGRPASSR